MPRFCPVIRSGILEAQMRLKTFLFSLSDLFLLLWVPPKGRAQTGTSVSRMKKMKLGKP
jgi:hypothetical protein